MTNLDSVLKSRGIILPTKVCTVRAVVFSSSRVWMWELGHKEGWALKNWCFPIVVLEKTPQRTLDCKEIKLARKLTLNMHWKDWCWSSNTLANWRKELTNWKRPWCWERLRAGGEGATEDEMVEWHHQLNDHEFEQTPGDSVIVKDREAWHAVVYGVAKSRAWLSDWTTTNT